MNEFILGGMWWFLWLFVVVICVFLCIVALIVIVILVILGYVAVAEYLEKRREKYKLGKAEAFVEKLGLHDNPTAKELQSILRKGNDGLLSVGIKLHCTGESANIRVKLNLDTNERQFRLQKANTCIILPPVGSADAAIRLIELLEKCSGVSIFRNPQVQIQVCTPGRLTNHNAALLGAAFYLGTDLLKRFGKEAHYTTQRGLTCDRLVIYDYKGEFDENFEWWGLDNGQLHVASTLPFTDERTDILGCQTKTDIRNVNLVASLLVHAQSNGYWRSVGKAFAEEFRQLFIRHHLGGVLDAVWVKQGVSVEASKATPEDELYMNQLLEMMDYVFGELGMIATSRSLQKPDLQHCILFEAVDLLAKYRAIIDVQQHRKEV